MKSMEQTVGGTIVCIGLAVAFHQHRREGLCRTPEICPADPSAKYKYNDYDDIKNWRYSNKHGHFVEFEGITITCGTYSSIDTRILL